MTYYYLFCVDIGYCGCSEEYLICDRRKWSDKELQQYLDQLSFEYAQDCIDECLDSDATEEEVDEFYATASILGNYKQLSEEEAWEKIKLGYDITNFAEE